MKRTFRRKPRNSERNGCPRGRPEHSLNSYADVVRDFRETHRVRMRRYRQFHAAQTSLSSAIEIAALCKTAEGKRQSHQRRLSASTLRLALAALVRCDLSTCKTFDELFQTIDDAIGGIHGIGELTVYDVAERIGAYLNLEPEKVYLHAGTRVGARALGLGRGTDTLEIRELPSAFRRLTPGEIEDCLCIYKDELKQIKNT